MTNATMEMYQLLNISKEVSEFTECNEKVVLGSMTVEKLDQIATEIVDDLLLFEEEIQGYIENTPEPISEEELNKEHTSY